MHLYPITITALILAMVGCGGQEEEDQVSSAANLDNTTNTTSTPSNPPPLQTNTATVKTSELITNAEFDLTSDLELTVNVPAAPSNSISYFINICSTYSNIDGSVTIQYDSCKLRAPLTSVQQQYNLTLSSTELQLIAQIWPIESGAKPITRYFENNTSDNNWDILL